MSSIQNRSVKTHSTPEGALMESPVFLSDLFTAHEPISIASSISTTCKSGSWEREHLWKLDVSWAMHGGARLRRALTSNSPELGLDGVLPHPVHRLVFIAKKKIVDYL